MVYIKSKEDIKILKQSGKLLSSMLKLLTNNAKIGVRLKELNKIAINFAKENDAEATFYGYQPEGADKPFPAAICTSINEVVVHQVPNNYKLKSGDMLKIDAGITYKGMITDSATTVAVGKISINSKKLIQSTQRALSDAIKQAKPGKTLGDIGYAIYNRAKKDGFFVLRDLTGHGVGYELHEDPVIFNFGTKGDGLKLKEGMVIAIEPMFSTTSESIIQNEDESYSTYGGGMTAHFEHSLAIVKGGNVILTK